MRPPRQITVAALNAAVVLTGPGGIPTATSVIEPFGGVPLASPDVLWPTTYPAGWYVPWGRYEVDGVAYEFRPNDLAGFLAAYNASHPSADLTGSASPGLPMYGAPDGRVSTDDFLYFMELYS